MFGGNAKEKHHQLLEAELQGQARLRARSVLLR
jgi:hypothetical protein